MKYIYTKIYTTFLVIVLILMISACQPTKTESNQMQSNTEASNMEITDSHMGCQEGEVNKDGKCYPAENNNAELFGQDLDQYVNSQEINKPVHGFIATPKNPGKYPGIVMIHEWWGLNDNIKEMAKLLAKEGYVVYAVDLYDGHVANDSTEATKLMSSVNNDQKTAVDKLKQAAEFLRQDKKVPKIASLGWCFGGGQSLQLSLNDKLDATVIYYGFLVDDKAQLSNIKWPVLGIFGDKDMAINVESVKKFKANLNELGIKNDIYIYKGVGHAFANPSGSNYAKKETVDAWNKTIVFLNKNLKS